MGLGRWQNENNPPATVEQAGRRSKQGAIGAKPFPLLLIVLQGQRLSGGQPWVLAPEDDARDRNALP
jgi:hypothetical protein